MPDDTARWSSAQVLALAPDPSSQRAGQGLAAAGTWRDAGHQDASVWGLCQGSGKSPYQTCVDLAEPAYRCSCPSRKFPCKHAIGLLLLWSGGGAPSAEPPDWVSDWLAERGERSKRKQSTQKQSTQGSADPRDAPDGGEQTDLEPHVSAGRKARPGNITTGTQARRVMRVDAGIVELERWLTDQVRQGLAGSVRAGYSHWDTMAARLVDAQAPGLASAVRRLATVAGDPERLLAEFGQLWLLVRAYQRLDELPPELAATVRSRIGFTTATDDVLAGPRVHDHWVVIGIRDEYDERLTVRRTWLRGAVTHQAALVLSFAAAGQALPADLVAGTSVEADLCFYPGAQPLRALVAHRYGEPGAATAPTGSPTIAAGLDDVAVAVAREPWLDRWPMVLDEVTPVPAGDGWRLRDRDGLAIALELASPWALVAAAGAAPCTVGGEWSGRALRPLSAWIDGELVTL